MRLISLIFLVLVIKTNFGQDFVDALKVSEDFRLNNGMQIVLITNINTDRIYYSIFTDNPPFDYSPLKYDIAAKLSGFSRYYFLLTKKIVSDTNAIDSTLKFIAQIFNQPRDNSSLLAFLKTQKLLEADRKQINDLMVPKFCLGFKNPYAKFFTKDEVIKLKKDEIDQLHKLYFNSRNTTLIIVGNFKIDSIKQLIISRLSIVLSGEKLQTNYQSRKFTTKPGVYFVETEGKTIADFCLPFVVDNDLKSKVMNDLFMMWLQITFGRKQADFSVFNDTVQLKILNDFYQKCIRISMLPKKNDIYDNLFVIENFFEDLKNIDTTDFNFIKDRQADIFDKKLKTEKGISDIAFIIKKYHFSKKYTYEYRKKLEELTLNDFKEFLDEILEPDSAKYIVFGNERNVVCQLYSLAKRFTVYKYDKNYHLYGKIKKGFDSRFVINDYLSAVNAKVNIRNIIIFFDADYRIDTIYRLKGIILKRSPYFYRYKTIFIEGKDTLLHNLQIANGQIWIDSTAIGTRKYTREEFFARIYKAYIFPELYYDSLGYRTELVCDTGEIYNNIFTVKVNTGHNVVYYDHYDLNKKRKIRTEINLVREGREIPMEVIEYDDYKKISDKSDLIMPFKVVEYFGGFKIVQKVTEIRLRPKISKSYFEID